MRLQQELANGQSRICRHGSGLADDEGGGAAGVWRRGVGMARLVCHTYNAFPGPNSNTFTAWVARQVPALDLHLPFSASGGGYGN